MNFQDYNIEIKGRTSGNVKTKCPKCGDKTSLSVNITEGVWNCHKPSCAWKGSLNKKREQQVKQHYTKPAWTNSTKLSDQVVKFFSARGISQQTLQQAKISEGVEYMPQVNAKKTVIQFNYFRDGELVNVKYRDRDKNFKMISGAELVFYNLDGIKDQEDIIIVEGEIDALSYIEAGYTNVVSVPNGASRGAQRLEYLDNCVEYFENAKKIYVAVDQDEAGLALKNELLRRLDVDRCYDVDLKDCKDANEFLQKHGKLELAETIRLAKSFPVKGVIFAMQQKSDYDDLYERGLQRGAGIRIEAVDKLITYEPGKMTVITGIPSHGKSYWLDFVLARLSFIHGWRTGMFSPEHFPIKLHLARLAEKIIGKSFTGQARMNHIEKDKALEYMNDNFFFIRPDNESFELDNILAIAKSLVLRHGINSLVIDPWNRLVSPETRSETNFISKQLDKIIDFQQKHNVHTFIVAHPTKMKKDKDTGLYEVPNLYDIAGSATFFSKPDAGVTIYRNFSEKVTTILVQKMKYAHLGEVGKAEMRFNMTNGRFHLVDQPEDNSNYFNLKDNISQLTIGAHTKVEIFPNMNPDKYIEPVVVKDGDEMPF